MRLNTYFLSLLNKISPHELKIKLNNIFLRARKEPINENHLRWDISNTKGHKERQAYDFPPTKR